MLSSEVWWSRVSCDSPWGSPDRGARYMSSWGIRMELLRRHSTRMYHIRNSSPPTFHQDISHPAPSPDISHPALDAGWERRAFQLPRSDISGSSDSAYPKSFAAILHSVAVFSWSFLIFSTDFLRYFALDIWCLNPQTLLVTHQL